MFIARLFTVALVLAALPLPAHAVEEAPTVLQCSGVSGFVSAWTVAGEPYARLVVHGTVGELTTVGDVAYTVICGRPLLDVVCVEESAAGLALGAAVTVQGVVSRADGSELVLDPCGAILRR
jgi:hypothetical protein